MSDLPGMDILLPPQSKEAEEALIGAALLNPAGLETIGFLNELDFYFGTPRTIWKAIQALRESKVPIDFLTITDKLDKCGDLEAVGGPAGLAGIINNVPMSLNAEAYARIIKDKSQRRSLLTQANSLAKIAYDETQPVAEPLSGVLDSIMNATRAPDKESRHISHGLKDLYEYVAARRLDPREVWGIPTGFPDLDSFTGGLHTSQVLYIAGEPGVGKTKLANQIGIQAALPENGSHGVCLYSFEMPEIEIVKRVVSGRRHITTFAMNSGKVSDEIFQEYLDDTAYIERLPIYVCDRPMNPQEFHADLTRRKKDGVELFILDYLLLMEGYDNVDETPRSAILSRKVKNIAQSVGMAGLTVASVVKDVIASTAAPTNKGMRGSAQVIHDSDGIAFLTQCQDPGMQDVAYLTFTKMPRTVNRSLAKATISLVIDNQYPIFHSATTREIDLNGIR